MKLSDKHPETKLRFWSFWRQVFNKWFADKGSKMAAALSFYTLFALAPLFLLATGIAGFIFEKEEAQAELRRQILNWVGKPGGEALLSLVGDFHHRLGGSWAAVVGAFIFLLSVTAVFAELKDSLDLIWGVRKEGSGILSALKTRALSFLIVVGIGILLLVSVFASWIFSFLASLEVFQFLKTTPISLSFNFVLSLSCLTLFFALVYRTLPDVAIAWSDVWLGSFVTALLISLGRVAISTYLAKSGFTSIYGAASSVIIILLWVYYTAQLLFVGAEITQVYATEIGSRRRLAKKKRL